MSKLDDILNELPAEEAEFVKPQIKALMLELIDDADTFPTGKKGMLGGYDHHIRRKVEAL